jgi:hypothetical protein
MAKSEGMGIILNTYRHTHSNGWDVVIMDKLVGMLHYFIHRGRSTLCRTVLCKLCYFSDFDFYELNERSITGNRYQRLLSGPAPFDFDILMDYLQDANMAAEEEMNIESHRRFRYRSLKEPDMSVFTQDERDVMDWVFGRYGSMTANALNDLANKEIPMRMTIENDEIPYEWVFYRDPITSVLDLETEEADC